MTLSHQLTTARKEGLTSTNQLLILLTLQFEQSGLSIGALARALDVTNAAITGIADKLDSLGLTIRIHSKADRRVIFLKLTQKGRDLVAKLQPATTTPAIA